MRLLVTLSLCRLGTFRGDFSKESFFNQIAAAQRRVDRYAAQAAAAATDLSQSEIVGVKVAGGFGPIRFEDSQMTWLERSPEDAIMAISQGFANALLADQLNTAITAGVAAISNQASLVNDVSAQSGGAGALTQTVLNGSHAKFGDRSQLLTADVMTGAAYHKLLEKGLQNGERLFEAGNVRVQSILGKLFVITDSPALFESGTPNKFKVLSLTAGAIMVDNASDVIANMERNNGQTRIETTWQADYTFGLKLKGYAWDVANGGRSPSDAAIATGSNWDKAVAEDKHTAGTIAIADSDQ